MMVFIFLFVINMPVLAYITGQGGILSELGTSFVIGIEKSFFLAKAHSLNISLNYATGYQSEFCLHYRVTSVHHFIMPGADLSAYLIRSKVKHFEPFIDYGCGYVLAVLRKYGYRGRTDTDIDNGGFMKMTFGSDFPIKSSVLPFIETGVWVIIGVDGNTYTNFAFLAGLRFRI